MKTNDKMIVAFLVAAGVFSLNVATRYVGGLTDVQKKSILPAAKMSSHKVLLCEGTEWSKYSNPKSSEA